MILVVVEYDVLDEVQLKYALLITLAHDENHEWEEAGILQLCHD